MLLLLVCTYYKILSHMFLLLFIFQRLLKICATLLLHYLKLMLHAIAWHTYTRSHIYTILLCCHRMFCPRASAACRILNAFLWWVKSGSRWLAMGECSVRFTVVQPTCNACWNGQRADGWRLFITACISVACSSRPSWKRSTCMHLM